MAAVIEKMNKKVTIKDIANALNISHSTVSVVLGGREKELHLNADTCSRVRETAKQMGYRPNMFAKCLRKQCSYSIGILLPSPKDPYYAAMVAEMQHLLADSEYTGIFSFWDTRDKIQKATLRILQRGVDGVVTCESDYLPPELDIPVVTYVNEDPRYDYVGLVAHMYDHLAIRYLRGLGHEKIAMASRSNMSYSAEFNQKLEKHGLLPLDPDYRIDMSRPESIGKYFAERLKTNRLPTAVIAFYDRDALLVMQHAWMSGIRIPEQLSIVVYNNELNLVPELTTLKCVRPSMSEKIIELLLNRLKNPAVPRQKAILQIQVIEGGTCAPAR